MFDTVLLAFGVAGSLGEHRDSHQHPGRFDVEQTTITLGIPPKAVLRARVVTESTVGEPLAVT